MQLRCARFDRTKMQSTVVAGRERLVQTEAYHSDGRMSRWDAVVTLHNALLRQSTLNAAAWRPECSR
jgi:hypothetical protein